MAASLCQINKFIARLSGLLPKNLIQETIREPGVPLELLKKTHSILTILQPVHQDNGQTWAALKSIERDETPC